MSDESYFLLASKEYAEGKAKEDLLAKARYLVEGAESKIEFKYVELRVKQLKSEKASKYVSAAHEAGTIIGPALGGFLGHLLKTIFIAVVGLGAIALLLNAFN